MPTSNSECFRSFSMLYRSSFDATSCSSSTVPHRCAGIILPDNISLLFLPPYSPELNPKENIWDEICEKIFKNYALKSMDSVHEKLNEAVIHIESNPKMVKSVTSFPYFVGSL
jgi:DDE superfamily endonuclease